MKVSIKEVPGKLRRQHTGELIHSVRGHRAVILDDDDRQVWVTSVCATEEIARRVADG